MIFKEKHFASPQLHPNNDLLIAALNGHGHQLPQNLAREVRENLISPNEDHRRLYNLKNVRRLINLSTQQPNITMREWALTELRIPKEKIEEYKVVDLKSDNYTQVVKEDEKIHSAKVIANSNPETVSMAGHGDHVLKIQKSAKSGLTHLLVEVRFTKLPGPGKLHPTSSYKYCMITLESQPLQQAWEKSFVMDSPVLREVALTLDPSKGTILDSFLKTIRFGYYYYFDQQHQSQLSQLIEKAKEELNLNTLQIAVMLLSIKDVPTRALMHLQRYCLDHAMDATILVPERRDRYAGKNDPKTVNFPYWTTNAVDREVYQELAKLMDVSRLCQLSSTDRVKPSFEEALSETNPSLPETTHSEIFTTVSCEVSFPTHVPVLPEKMDPHKEEKIIDFKVIRQSHPGLVTVEYRPAFSGSQQKLFVGREMYAEGNFNATVLVELTTNKGKKFVNLNVLSKDNVFLQKERQKFKSLNTATFMFGAYEQPHALFALT